MKYLLSIMVGYFLLSHLVLAQGFRREASIGKHSVGLGLEFDGYSDRDGFFDEVALGFGISANYDYKFSNLITGVFQVGYVKFGVTKGYGSVKSEMIFILTGAKFRLFQNFYTIGQIGVGFKNMDSEETKYGYYYSNIWPYYNYYSYQAPKSDNTTVNLFAFGFGYKFQLSTKLELDATAKYITTFGTRKPTNSLNLRVAAVYHF